MLVKLLREYLRPYRAPIALIVGLQFLATLAMLYLPTLNANIIDTGVLTGNSGYIWKTGALMLAITLGQIACQICAVYFAARTAMAVGRDLRSAQFRQVQRFSAREIGQIGTPSLITRSTNDVQQVQMLVLMFFVMTVSAPIMMVGSIVLALDQNVTLSGLLVVIIPVLAIVLGLIISRMVPLFRATQGKLDSINRVLREQITGVRVVRAFVRDERERDRFEDASNELLQVSLGAGKLMSLMFPSVMVVVNLSSVAVLWFGGHLINDGSMQIGALTAFLSYLMQTLMSIMMTVFTFMMVPRAEVSAERIREVLTTESSVVPAANPRVPDLLRGTLELRSVDFCYPGAEKSVLHDVSLLARPGEVTAIIGSTGAGKTTLLSLIPRLMDVTGGEVLVDGIDVRELDANVLSKTVGYVPQRPYLFSGTVASNLRYGNRDATDEELWQALETAQGRDFVEAMPEGLNAPIAQGGTNVSGGQRQRLAIARTLVRKPEVYLFDDSFSALDYATDARLRAALARETQEATVVIVAQRVSTIRQADTIIVLDEGRVVGTGTHSELMDGNETYREIVLSQLTEQEAAA
ncbi:ABC transporter ATP-binding protein [Actinospica sp.]|uniref:ABC transporter ATP-binding protein n=1 Tax=Actinospica sp. TaxID=1872142 RepID=UPI002C90C41C|nr:ABC transporter ATP-binding protein [Actinospica sp.]HWG27781.1 ABC transporter ATP-binding protein [Actinospica sp.]